MKCRINGFVYALLGITSAVGRESVDERLEFLDILCKIKFLYYVVVTLVAEGNKPEANIRHWLAALYLCHHIFDLVFDDLELVGHTSRCVNHKDHIDSGFAIVCNQGCWPRKEA